MDFLHLLKGMDFFIWTIKNYGGMAGSVLRVLLKKQSTQTLDEFMRNISHGRWCQGQFLVRV